MWWVSAADPAAGGGDAGGGPPPGVSEAELDLVMPPIDLAVPAASADRWLLVVDNADDPQVLAGPGRSVAEGRGWLRPVTGQAGRVLVTSRDGRPPAGDHGVTGTGWECFPPNRPQRFWPIMPGITPDWAARTTRGGWRCGWAACRWR